ncbi:MAG: hypothetical protein ACXWWK_02685 [Gemmatimonadales bacterium]
MRVHSSMRFAAMAALVGALACAGNTARDTDTDEAGAARDTTTTDTLGQNQPGYRGMERDTTIAPPSEGQPSDTFLQNQGVGGAQDTSGYSGAERVDTSARVQEDTTSMTRDTSWSKTGDTTGYNPSQQPGDSVSR